MSMYRHISNIIMNIFPPRRAFKLKARIWRFGNVLVASDCRLISSVRIWTSGAVEIGADTFLGHEVMIVGGDAPVRVGARCDIAPRVLLVTGTHLDGGRNRAAGRGISHPIQIGDGVWIGAGSIVLGGVKIGEGAIIGAGSVVTQDIPPFAVAVGVPCRVIRKRDVDDLAGAS